jgi:hypothetical protein
MTKRIKRPRLGLVTGVMFLHIKESVFRAIQGEVRRHSGDFPDYSETFESGK